jgi:hypothetical protein
MDLKKVLAESLSLFFFLTEETVSPLGRKPWEAGTVQSLSNTHAKHIFQE